VSGQACPRNDDAASYVLRAMSDAECDAFQAHLGRCASCTAKVSELSFVGDALLSGVPQLTAPPVIRDRVMSVVRAESELLLAAGPEADRPVRPRAERRWSLAGFRPLPALALACLALALGIGGGALLTGGDGGPVRARTVVAQVNAAGATAHVRVTSDGAKLVMAGMPAPDDGRVYEVWLDRGGKSTPEPTDALFSVSSQGNATVDVPGDLDGVKAVLVTDEPQGGSKIPTRTPVISASLS
jgi:hypothetical protein